MDAANIFSPGMHVKYVDSIVPEIHGLSPGTQGVIESIDEEKGTIFVKWNDGRRLGMIPTIDSIEPV